MKVEYKLSNKEMKQINEICNFWVDFDDTI